MLQKYPKLFGGLTALVGMIFYVTWSGFDVPLPDVSNLNIKIESINESNTDSIHDSNTGLTIIAFAPAFQPSDYASPSHLTAKLTPYFDAARAGGLFDGPAIVLLPAHTLTPLLFTGYGSRVYNASSLGLAAMPIIAQNALEFGKNYFIFDSEQPLTAAFIRTQSEVAAAAIQTVFGGLAEKYGVYIVPGSGLLMTPGVYPDALAYGHGPVFHASFMFGPDGKAMEDAIREVTPSAMLSNTAKPSLAEFLPVFQVHGKRIMVLLEDDEPGGTSGPIDLVLTPVFGKPDVPENDNDIFRLVLSSNAQSWGLDGGGDGILLNKDGQSTHRQAADGQTLYVIRVDS